MQYLISSQLIFFKNSFPVLICRYIEDNNGKAQITPLGILLNTFLLSCKSSVLISCFCFCLCESNQKNQAFVTFITITLFQRKACILCTTHHKIIPHVLIWLTFSQIYKMGGWESCELIQRLRSRGHQLHVEMMICKDAEGSNLGAVGKSNRGRDSHCLRKLDGLMHLLTDNLVVFLKNPSKYSIKPSLFELINYKSPFS